MRKIKIIAEISVFIILVLTLKLIASEQISGDKSVYNGAQQLSYEITVKRDLLALMMAYPEYISGFEKTDDNIIYVIMKSGNKIVYDDMKVKSFNEKVANADIEDSMSQVYPLSDISTIMEEDFDPGRIRNYALLNEVYGSSQSKIEASLTTVTLGSRNCPFNKNNNAAASLKTAFQEISGLLSSSSNVYSFVYPVNGTYNYRIISGTGLLSPHSFGIAIDLKSNKCDYWQWATKEQGQSRLDSYPKELVKIFENNYFIWGGKWSHFDFLHFEYRPELIIKSKYYMDLNNDDSWYCGFPDTEQIKNYISIIEEAL